MQNSYSPRHGANVPFPRRPLLLALAVVLMAAALAFTLAMTSSGSGAPQAPAGGGHPVAASIVLDASVTLCRTTDSYTRSVSAAGTVRQKWTHKYACGRHYQEWEHITSQSPSGAHYRENVYRDERSYPHWWQQAQKWSWTAKGTFTYSSVVTSA
jgi:hypothetical protein